MSQIEFYFDFRSPYSYLASTQLGGLEVAWRPVDVMAVMKLVGNTPTTIVCAAKNRYANRDLARWAGRYRVPLLPNPRMREFDGRRPLRAALALARLDRFDAAAAAALFRAYWARPATLETGADVQAVLTAARVDTAGLADLDDPALDAELTAASEAAAERGVFGAPTFFVGEDMFFGNDRLDFLREHIARAA